MPATPAESSSKTNWEIAQIVGWSRLENPVEIKYFWRTGSQTTGQATVTNPAGHPSLEEWVPDFCGDLNAMHSAEKTLDIDEEYIYGDALAKEVRLDENRAAGAPAEKEFPFNGWGHYALATLDASVRARIFVELFRHKLGPSKKMPPQPPESSGDHKLMV
jgi:hypothetical protein